ncbi:hypothetical protein M378DRAFT_641058 [Amanita muscaria Koide BX008]|uniref:Uncharacterized protein n=1 Tax=Amanita muscaria (strain Koide BX008) TaxID=946122 RepID=A0A0C2X414_AMAMK|nr:hypothetical protein M378DRAFT_641058 [Amanita muscaria Koide BX008]
MGKLNRLLQEKTKELASLEESENQAKGRHENKIRILEENVSGMIADMNQEKEKYEEEIRGLQAKVYNLVEDMDQLKAEYEKEIRNLQAKTYNQKADVLDQEPGIEIPQKTSLQTNSLPPQAVVVRADSASVTEVAHLVKTLNAQIEQAVVLITESLSGLEPPVSDNKLEIAFDELHDHLGPWLYSKLRGDSGLDIWITQIFTLQTGLSNMCCCIVNDSPFWCDGSIYRHIYRNMAETDQAVADEWRAQTLSYITLAQCEDANKKYLTEIMLKLVTVAVGGIPESSESLLSQYNQRVEEIARTAAKLHKTITEDVISVELVTYTVSCDTEFDASQMEDTVNMSGSIPHGKVVCTHEMGLLCRKRVEPRKPRGSVKDWDVILKAKVVLAATLEA